MICQWAQASSSLTKFDRRKDKYHEYDEEEKEKKKTESKKRAGIRGKFLKYLFPTVENFFQRQKRFFSGLRPSRLGENHPQRDYGSKFGGTR